MIDNYYIAVNNHKENEMSKTLKQGFFLHTYNAASSFALGETVYVIYDYIGAVFTTCHESDLARFCEAA